MEKSHAVGADTEVEHENQDVVEVNCADVQKKLTMPKSGQSGFDAKSIGSEDDGSAETLIKGRLECLQNKADCDSGQALMLNVSPEMPVGSRSSNGLDLPQDKDATMQWELDKNLPPIKTRREGQSCDYSPSDLSPPSPKRMRQGSKEREDQWNGLWSADGALRKEGVRSALIDASIQFEGQTSSKSICMTDLPR